MFSLIITVISIALVAALALATLYYGGAAFNKGAAEAQASKILLQGQQLLGAAELYYTENREWPADLPTLVTDGYLKAIPTVRGPMGEALAVETGWEMPLPGRPLFSLATEQADVCRLVNKRSNNNDTVPATGSATYTAQCYGSGSSHTTLVARNVADVATQLAGGGGGSGFLSISQASFSFPDTRMAEFSGLYGAATLTNTAASGGDTVVLDPDFYYESGSFAAWYDDDCYDLGLVLAPGESCGLAMGFAPTSMGPLTGAFDLASSGGTLHVAMSGVGTAAAAQPLHLDSLSAFLRYGETLLRDVALHNYNSDAVSFLGAVSDDPSVATIDATDCPASLAAGASCLLHVTLTNSVPNVDNVVTSSVTVDSSNGPRTSSVGFVGQQPLNSQYNVPEPDQFVELGNTSAGQPISHTFNLTNPSATQPVWLTAPAFMAYGPTGSSVSASTCVGMLEPGASCSLTITNSSWPMGYDQVGAYVTLWNGTTANHQIIFSFRATGV